MSGPPRPRCRFCDRPRGRSDCDHCRGQSWLVYGVEFHTAYFGTTPVRYTAYPGQGRAGPVKEDAPS